nr:leucine-rich repeat protein [Lachnospiraceae bacterium]
MKLKGKRLLVFAIVALLCTGYAAWVFAGSSYHFAVSHDDPVDGIILYDGTVSANTVSGNSGTVSGNSGNESTISANTVTYGADIGFIITNEDDLEVEACITEAYSGEDVTIPDTVTYMDNKGVVTTYKVVGLQLAQSYDNHANFDVSKLDATMTVPKDLRTIYGNLFNWKEYVGQRSLKDEGYNNVALINSVDVPDSDGVKANLPHFITDHYTDGAYYLGKCLVRVAPDYAGDFTVKDGTVCILASAFEGCSKIGKVSLPDSVEFIGMRAFTNSSVTSINLPKGMIGNSNKITDYTFYGCKNLKEVIFDEGVTLSWIGPFAFMDCSALTGFDMEKAGTLSYFCFAGAFDPKANVEISMHASQFGEHPYLFSGELSANANPAVFAKSGIRKVNFRPGFDEIAQKEIEARLGTDHGEIAGYGYREIASDSFYHCQNLEEVNLSDSVLKIGAEAFEGCINLKDDILGQKDCKVQFLDYRCFANTGMTTATIPEKITDANGGVFALNPQLKTMNWYSRELYDDEYSDNIFGLLNDSCMDYKAKYMTEFDHNITSDKYGQQPIKKDNTYIETLHIYSSISCEIDGEKRDSFANQPYLKNLYIHNEEDVDIFIPRSFMQFSPALERVEFDHPECVKVIGENAFAFCPNLNHFPFEKMTGLEKIQKVAFQLSGYVSSSKYSKSGMEEWNASDPKTGYGLMGPLDLTKCVNLEKIDDAAFEMQFHITSLALNKTASMEESTGVFDGCISLKEVTTDGELKNLGKDGFGQNFYLPMSEHSFQIYSGASTSMYGVNDVVTTITAKHAKSIPYSTLGYFSSLWSLKSITLGEVETIPDRTFAYDVGLKKVSLPDTKILGDGNDCVFYGCDDFTLNVPNVTTVRANALHCNGIRNLSMPKAETFEGERPFEGMLKLEKLSLPSLTTVGDSFFSNYGLTGLRTSEIPTGELLPNLRSVELPAVKTVEANAFMETVLEKVELPEALTVGDRAFYGSQNLRSVSVPKVKDFSVNGSRSGNATMTFADCPSLESVELGENLKSITFADYMFAGSGIENFTIPGNAVCGKFMFNNCDDLESLTVEEGVKSLNWFICNECDMLSDVQLPDTLEQVSWAAFKNTPNLTQITIPGSVTEIEDDAFALYKKVRADQLEVTLFGSPLINNGMNDEDYNVRADAGLIMKPDQCNTEEDEEELQEIIGLKPIPDGSVIDCADENAYRAAVAYQEKYPDELENLKIVRMNPYTVNVNNGEGDGEYLRGTTVTIKADAAPADQVFEKWISADVTFADDRAEETTFIMPKKAVEISAIYRDRDAVASPVIDPADGIYEDRQAVILTSDTKDAEIYYTTDGSEPSTQSTKYVRPFFVSKTTVIKAIAVKEGLKDSLVTTAAITIKEEAKVTKAPAAVKDLIENKEELALVTAGAAEGGTIVYAISDDGTVPKASLFSEELPKAADAGYYTVWYKVQGDATHRDTQAMPVVVRIAEAA